MDRWQEFITIGEFVPGLVFTLTFLISVSGGKAHTL